MNHSVEVTHNSEFGATVRFTIAGRPWTTNAERKGNRWQRASATAEWRELFGWLARCQPLRNLTSATIRVELTQKGRLQDTGACFPAIKAAIDGLVDGGLLPDDTGDHVARIIFMAPIRDKHDQTTIVVTGDHANDD